jgi:chemotaxis-related protein WspB
MLLLMFRIADDSYAVDAARVVEVVPKVALRPVPHAPEMLVGLFHYRDTIAPVIDLGVLLGSSPCRERLSTRIVVVEYARTERSGALLGLLAERVDDLKTVPGRPIFPAMPLPRAPYLGPIVQADDILVQLIDVDRVVPEELREGLFGMVPEPS